MITALETILTAMIMSETYMDEEDAQECAHSIVRTLEEGYYREHGEKNPAGTTEFAFDDFRWQPGEDAPTPESVTKAQAAMQQRLTEIGITDQPRYKNVKTTWHTSGGNAPEQYSYEVPDIANDGGEDTMSEPLIVGVESPEGLRVGVQLADGSTVVSEPIPRGEPGPPQINTGMRRFVETERAGQTPSAADNHSEQMTP